MRWPVTLEDCGWWELMNDKHHLQLPVMCFRSRAPSDSHTLLMLYGPFPTSHHITDGASMHCHLCQDHAGFKQDNRCVDIYGAKQGFHIYLGSLDLHFQAYSVFISIMWFFTVFLGFSFKEEIFRTFKTGLFRKRKEFMLQNEWIPFIFTALTFISAGL